MAENGQEVSGRPDRWWRPHVSRGGFAVFSLLVLVFAFDALVQLDGLLKGMHIAGQPSFGASDLATFKPEKVLAVWEAHDAATSAAGHASHELVLALYVGVDMVFAFALFAFLVAVAGLVKREARAYKITVGAALVYVVADELESMTTLLIAFADMALGWLLIGLAIVKWIFLAAAALLIAGQALQQWRADESTRQGEIRNLTHLLRVLIILAPLFAFALIAHPQIPDLIRRWTPFQLLCAVALTTYLAVTLWFIACQLQLQHKPWKSLRRPRWIVGILLAAAGLQLLLTSLLHLAGANFDAGWGLMIPALLTAAGALLALILKGGSSQLQHRKLGAGTRDLPALIGASVLVGLGLGALRASLSEGVYTRTLWDLDGFWPSHGEQLHPLFLVLVSVALPALAWLLFLVLRGLTPDVTTSAGPGNGDERSRVGAAACPLAGAGEPPASPPDRGLAGYWWLVGSAAVLLELGVLAAILINVQGFAEGVGGIAVLAAFVAALVMLAGLVVWLSDSIAYPDVLPGRTAPIVLLVIAWFLIAAKLDRTGPHDIRVTESAYVADAPTLSEAWACWLVKNGLDPGARKCPFDQDEFRYRTTRAGGAVPLVVVATSGGATRAAYWTATVLDCVFEVDSDGSACELGGQRVKPGDFTRSNTIFALSGISGGSVGFATYAAHLAERADLGSQKDWIDSRLDRDFLSPTVSWTLFVELPQSVLRFKHPVDTAEVLERSWETAWGEGEARGTWRLFELWRSRHAVPLLLLNGTSVEDGCRFNGSVLDASVETAVKKTADSPAKVRFHDCRATGPFDDAPAANGTEQPGAQVLPKSVLGATRDLADFVCGRAGQKLDVPLSTVAILSARFPYVSPSGRVERRCPDDDQGNKVTYVVDGGYLETSGASPLVELQDKLEPMIRAHNSRASPGTCVIPFMIQIDNGYEDDAAASATARPTEAVVPPATILAVRGARAAGAKAQSALLFDRPYNGAQLDGQLLGDRYAHFVIQSHAGAKAPLGWALSKTAREALRAQLTQPKNAAALAETRRWLQGNLTCPAS